MDTRKIASEYRLTQWAQVIHERNESGLSIRAFCKKAGIGENVYYHWQRKLRAAACEQLVESHAGPTELLVPSTTFAEIRMTEPTEQPTLPESGRIGEVRVEVNGYQISAVSTYPPE